MAKEWMLVGKDKKTVEGVILQMLESHVTYLPDTLASYLIIDISDDVWKGHEWLTKRQMKEIRDSVPPVKLESDRLAHDEKNAIGILEELMGPQNQRMDLPTLRKKYDTFMADNEGKVHYNLLLWMHSCLNNFIWTCGQSGATTARPEITYSLDFWNIIRDRVPLRVQSIGGRFSH